MKSLKVMQLTSFEGNIGDVFYSEPFPDLISEALKTDVEITRAHIRDFYLNSRKRNFDAEFLHKINCHDLFVVGGGQYFDVRWDYSHTGTTLNMSDGFIEGIKVPVVLNGLGYTEPYDVKENNAVQKQIFKKFERFISNVSKRDNWLLTVRNDGSIERIANRFGQGFAALLHETPDVGFYFDKDIIPYEFEEKLPTVGFSIGNDTFTDDVTAKNKTRHLNDGVAKIIQALISKGMRVVFFLHMPRDIDAVHQIMQRVGVEGFRKNVVIAPYNTSGFTAAKTIVSYYKACDIVIAMRFHANVIALQNSIPSIGLVLDGIVSGERIAALYDKLQMGCYVLQVDETDLNFAERLQGMLAHVLSDRSKCILLEKAAMKKIIMQRREYCTTVRSFYNRQNNAEK